MRPPIQSTIAVTADDGTTAYGRARRLLRLGELAAQEASAEPRFIVDLPLKPVRDPAAVSERALTESLLYLRKKYSEE